MLLAIDAGNTNVVFAVHDGREWRGRWRIATRADRTSDEYAVWLLALFGHCGLKPGDIARCAIGTVVPAALYGLRRLSREWFEVEPLIARAAVDWGFEIKVDRPGEVGADRLLNALASQHHYGGPLVVVDFGTATTFDVVDAEGAYIGGVIARIRGEQGAPLKVVATGGLAPLFSEGTTTIEVIDQDITLEGLRLLADRNPAPIFTRTGPRDPPYIPA